jgi:hypothetical protein
MKASVGFGLGLPRGRSIARSGPLRKFQLSAATSYPTSPPKRTLTWRTRYLIHEPKWRGSRLTTWCIIPPILKCACTFCGESLPYHLLVVRQHNNHNGHPPFHTDKQCSAMCPRCTRFATKAAAHEVLAAHNDLPREASSGWAYHLSEACARLQS